MGDEEQNQDSLERNGLKHNNTLWKMMVSNESDYDIKKLKGTEWIATWRVFYETWQFTMNLISMAWNRIDHNMEIRYGMW